MKKGEIWRMTQNTGMAVEILDTTATNVRVKVIASMSSVLVGNVEDYDPKVFKAHFKKVEA